MTLYCAYIVSNLFVATPQCDIKTPAPKAYTLHTRLPKPKFNPVKIRPAGSKSQQLPKVSFNVGFTMRF